MRVLVADDQPLDRSVLRLSLEKWGYEVVEAADGREAIDALSEEHGPSLAIVDWMMPEVTGPEVCETVRYRGGDRYIYIILVTSRDEKDDIVKGLSAGADDYIVKPVDLQELQVRLRTGRRIVELQQELLATREELRFQATRDFLTGVWNRGSTVSKLKDEIGRAERRTDQLGVLMCDIDHFKAINDTLGHPAGDAVLVEVASRMQSVVRTYDVLGRFGGEEFLVVAPSTDVPGVTALGERLRAVVSGRPVIVEDTPIDVTLSVGGTSCPVDARTTVDGLLAQADQALYAAKDAGRNRVALASLTPG